MSVSIKDMRKVVEIAMQAEGKNPDRLSEDEVMALNACPQLLLKCLDKMEAVKTDLNSLVDPDFETILPTVQKKNSYPDQRFTINDQQPVISGSRLTH